MFKRLKDKITEEVKISPSKFTASVQQLQQIAQAVVSPNSNSAIDVPSMDSFSIDGDYDETPQNSPAHGSSRTSERGTPSKSSSGDPSTFTLVDLQDSSNTPVSGYASSRRSSFASTTSESPAILFPVLETGTANHFQSDLESCSERDESIFSSNVDNVSKEQLLSAFRKTQQRYHKYKGRYTDLIRHYRELERENSKARTVLAECQDKALRRAAELKEQCQLEQKAKAHLEEVLRSDLEEKDHLIHTLETKIQLLKSGVDPTRVLSAAASAAAGSAATDAPVIALSDSTTEAILPPEALTNEDLRNQAAILELEVEKKLQEKITNLEGLVQKCKEAVRTREERISVLEKNKESLTEREAELQNKIEVLRLREEETSFSVAENKLMVHQELESKEEVIRQLKKQLASANSKSSELQREIEQLQEGFKKDLAVGKQEASRLIQAEMQHIVVSNRKLEELLEKRTQQLSDQEASLSTANLRLQELKDELESVRGSKQLEASSELSSLQATVAKLESALKQSDLSLRLEPVLKPLREIRESSQQLREEVTESLKATKSYIQDSVQDIHSRSSQILAESTEELKRLRENQERSESEVEELSGRIQLLESQLKEKEEAVSSLESQLSDEKNSCSNLKKALEKLEDDVKEREEEKHRLEEQLEKSKLSLEESRKDLEEMREGHLSAESSEKKFIEELQEHVKTKEDELERLSGNLKLLEERLEEKTAEANRVPSLEAQVDFLESDNARLVEEQKNLTNEKDGELVARDEKNALLNKELDALKVEKDKLSEEIAKLEDVMVENEAIQISEVQRFETILNEKNIENEQLRNALNTLQASCNSLKEEHSVLSRKLEDTEEKCKALESELETAKVETREKEQLMSALEAQVTSLSSSSLDVRVLEGDKEELLERVTLLESRLGLCSQEMQEKETAMEEKNVELGNLLNLKTQELQELMQELGLCKSELSNQRNLIESKTKECESLVTRTSAFQDDLNSKSRELLEKVNECEELASQKALLEKEKEDSRVIVEQVAARVEESETLRRENVDLAQKLSDAVLAKEKLEFELKMLSEELRSQAHALKIKTDECAEKEAQLDNFADEMKRVDELSQELGRISEESEANVQVLSAEASSLAQKVEELTAKTQQMKEREVELVAKAELADACQAEFVQLKEAKAELQERLARAAQAERQLELIKEAQVELGNRLKQAEGFEKQCEQSKEMAAKVPELEARCVELNEEVKRTQERVEEKCRLLKEGEAKSVLLEERLDEAQERATLLQAKCAQLDEAQKKLPQLEAELGELRCRCEELTEERDRLSEENSTLSVMEKECSALKTENEKIAVLLKDCAELKEAKAEVQELKIRCSELEERLKMSSDANSELEKLREGSLELEKLRMTNKHLADTEEKLKCVQEECKQLKKDCAHVNDLEAENKALRSENARIGQLEEALSNANQVNSMEKEERGVFDDDHLDGKHSSRAVEVEAECEDLREQLKAAKTEIEDLRSDLEFVRTVPIERSMSPNKKQRISSLVSGLEDDHSLPVPVVEEIVVAKKVTDLYHSSKGDGDDTGSEDDDDDMYEEPGGLKKIQKNWKEAYESLLKEHQASTESNQKIIEDLKGQIKPRDEKPRRKPWERKEQEKASFAALESKALTVEGNSVGLVDRLQQEIAGLQTQLKDSKRQHRQEVSELRRMLLNNSHGALHGATLEDATELEYLRNILYEYMMGKEPMVLARVIAAVVKFDSDQTKKVLQKEEQRMTLLGHLGIS